MKALIQKTGAIDPLLMLFAPPGWFAPALAPAPAPAQALDPTPNPIPTIPSLESTGQCQEIDLLMARFNVATEAMYKNLPAIPSSNSLCSELSTFDP